MVRILANGEIVQDNDPRVRRNVPQQGSRYGYVNTNEQDQQRYSQGAYQNGNQGPTIFDTWNQKLLDLGIPRWNIGSHVVEPIMTVMALVVLLFVGLHGVLFLGLLYFVVKYSQRQTAQPPTTRPGAGTGSGRRLGR